ncbi:MinD/ParA family protein [Psychromicrobium sp. YIM B11713]|uniref:MinD/ParA family ATP-binding protein n=1 Tax=Psychromicrobium sp. YIM B11713 TaxID=3145233 RepID=UPI00374F6BFA
MSELNEFVLVEVFHDGRISVAGQPVDAHGHSDSYAAAVALLAGQAAHHQSRVLAKALDHRNGEISWFFVDSRGEVFDAFSGPQVSAHGVSAPAATANPAAIANPAASASDGMEFAHEAPISYPQQPEYGPSEPAISGAEDLEITRKRPRYREADLPEPSPVPGPEAAQMSGIFRATIEPAAPISQIPAQEQLLNPERPGNLETTEWPNSRPVAAIPAMPSAQPAVAGSRMANRQFVRPPKDRPTQGIRRAVYSVSGGTVNLGKSPREREEAELESRIARQLPGSYNTAVLSLKGGIGKTSTTVGVGMMLAEYRGDPPCAIDANPDSGDLAERALGELLYQPEGSRTISDVIREIDSIRTLTELSRYMHHANRMHLVAGEQDPALSDALTAEEYLRIRELIAQYYSVILTDCGTGVSHPAMSGILSTATNLVVAAGYAVSGAKRARSTLEWLSGHGYHELARNAIVVITDKDEVSSRVDKRAIDAELAGHCKQLIAVPHDRGVADGDQISLDTLRPQTRRAYKEIAAAIVDGYH